MLTPCFSRPYNIHIHKHQSTTNIILVLYSCSLPVVAPLAATQAPTQSGGSRYSAPPASTACRHSVAVPVCFILYVLDLFSHKPIRRSAQSRRTREAFAEFRRRGRGVARSGLASLGQQNEHSRRRRRRTGWGRGRAAGRARQQGRWRLRHSARAGWSCSSGSASGSSSHRAWRSRWCRRGGPRPHHGGAAQLLRRYEAGPGMRCAPAASFQQQPPACAALHLLASSSSPWRALQPASQPASAACMHAHGPALLALTGHCRRCCFRHCFVLNAAITAPAASLCLSLPALHLPLLHAVSPAEVDDLEGSSGLLEEGQLYRLPVLPLDGGCGSCRLDGQRGVVWGGVG